MKTQYFTVELNGELAGMFQSNSVEMAAVQIAQLKLSQPELIVKNISEKRYKSLLSVVNGTSKSVLH